MNDIMEKKNNHGLSTVDELTVMMKKIIEMETRSVLRLDSIDERTTNTEKRLDRLENDTQLTTQQRNSVKRSVNRRVYELLSLPENKKDWSIENKVVCDKYSHLFHSRCYTETSRLGHLASPYGDTTQKNFTDAIKDIEAWIPANGITGLMHEADENAIARKIAREQGY